MNNKTCVVCQNPITGNAKKRFCSEKCKKSFQRSGQDIQESGQESEQIGTKPEIGTTSGQVKRMSDISWTWDDFTWSTDNNAWTHIVTGETITMQQHIDMQPDEDEDFKPHCKDCQVDPRKGAPNWFTNLHLTGKVKSREDFIDKLLNGTLKPML